MKTVKFVVGLAVGVAASAAATGLGDVRAQPVTPSGLVPPRPSLTAGTPAMEVMPRAYSPRMTRMPQSHLIAAFALTQHGQALYIDTHGKVIGRADPQTHQVIWDGNRPYTAQPISSVFSGPLAVPQYTPVRPTRP